MTYYIEHRTMCGDVELIPVEEKQPYIADFDRKLIPVEIVDSNNFQVIRYTYSSGSSVEIKLDEIIRLLKSIENILERKL